jgi:6-phosphogluconolactonase
MRSSNHEWIAYDTIEQLVDAAAEQVVEVAGHALSERGNFSLVLSGGSTPRPLYERLAGTPYRSRIDWSRTHLFWGDERCVPPTHQDSNYLMAKTALIDHVSIPEKNIHRIQGELGAEAAAEGYEQALRSFFKTRRLPEFDLVLLGMGDDGHTASLFPGTAPIHEEQRWVAGHFVGKLDAWRVTLTPPALNAAGRVIFLVAGGGKAARLHQVLEGPYQPDHLPSQVIQPEVGQMLWLVDRSAAARLSV